MAKARARTRRKMAGSLASAASFEAFVLDQLAEISDLRSRKMFGGVGLYSRGLFFGIIARDTLYLKVDDRTKHRYVDAGSQPFKPYADRSGTMRYYAVPVDVLESAPELTRWASEAVAVAGRAAKG
jgi:DNA transformation protein and related proteins